MITSLRVLRFLGLTVMLITMSVLMVSSAQAQMILPLPLDLDSMPAFRISGGAASAGPISDFAKLDIAENASIGALFEFSPLRKPDTRGWFKRLTIYKTINKGSNDWLGEGESFDAGQLLFPLTKDVAVMSGGYLSIYRWGSNDSTDRNEIAIFEDYSLQQRKISKDSTTVPDNPPVFIELPLNVIIWQCGLKYSWTTMKKDAVPSKDIYETSIGRNSAESLIRIAESDSDSAEGPLGGSNVNLAKEILEIWDKNQIDTTKSCKMVRLTGGIYFIYIHITKNTMDTFRTILNECDLKGRYPGVGAKFAFQYRSFGYEFDYRFIWPREPDVRGLMGSSFATRISISGQILDAF
ncbi:MAG: hypothetical protein V3W18_14485 [candidate division Zixibacteria bacterium]